MSYTVDLRRDSADWWVASVREVSGCHTQGRSIRQARTRIREAIAACADGAEVLDSDLDVRVHLPALARQAVARLELANRSLQREQDAARTASDAAVKELVAVERLSVRDTADLLGLSHQRVHQLTRGR